MCIQNVTAVLVLMHIWKSTPHNLYYSYFLKLKFLNPLNTNTIDGNIYVISHVMR